MSWPKFVVVFSMEPRLDIVPETATQFWCNFNDEINLIKESIKDESVTKNGDFFTTTRAKLVAIQDCKFVSMHLFCNNLLFIIYYLLTITIMSLHQF